MVLSSHNILKLIYNLWMSDSVVNRTKFLSIYENFWRIIFDHFVFFDVRHPRLSMHLSNRLFSRFQFHYRLYQKWILVGVPENRHRMNLNMLTKMSMGRNNHSWLCFHKIHNFHIYHNTPQKDYFCLLNFEWDKILYSNSKRNLKFKK